MCTKLNTAFHLYIFLTIRLGLLVNHNLLFQDPFVYSRILFSVHLHGVQPFLHPFRAHLSVPSRYVTITTAFEDISTDRISMSLFLIWKDIFSLFLCVCPSSHLENIPESILLAFMLTKQTSLSPENPELLKMYIWLSIII